MIATAVARENVTGAVTMVARQVGDRYRGGVASSTSEWVLLAYRIPREPSTPRISVWRKLRRLGAVQILDGLVGLPIIGGGQAAARNLRHESASLLYLRNQSLSLSELGTLDSRPALANDACRASCVDWYGNSRPLFVRKRVFALMGYEIVEGRVLDDRIAEVRRVNYAPQSGDYAMISK